MSSFPAIATLVFASIAATAHGSEQSGPQLDHAKQAPLPFAIQVHGNFKHMKHTGDYRPKVRLNDVVSAKGDYALGALSGMRGEITVIDGKPFVSVGSHASSRMLQGDAAQEQAALLVAAKARQWKEVSIPNDLSQSQFEAFVIETARKEGFDMAQPFPFMLSGELADYALHVVAAAPPTAGGHAHGGHAAQFSASGKSIKGRLLGFYSGPALSGVISHPNELFHVHIVDADQTLSAHVDAYGVRKLATLLLPVADANQRQQEVAARGALVMPFALDATTHVFSKTAQGGNMRVVAKSASDAEQIRLIRSHLRDIETHFARGDFSRPAAIHGETMPGLAELKRAKPGELAVRYVELPDGAELQFSSTQAPIFGAVHRWFDAQLADHGKDAKAGHAHQH